MKKLFNKLMLSCKQATALIDKRSLTKLSFNEKVMLRVHTSMCEFCTAYQKQSVILDDILHKHARLKDEDQVPLKSNEELKEKLLSKF